VSLSQAIKDHALIEAQSGDWLAVSNILKSISVTAIPRECGSVETADALLAVGSNPFQDLDALNYDATGQLLLSKLSTQGVAWAHRLTVPYLQGLVSAGKLSQVSVDAMKALSAPTTYPWADVTPEECSAAHLVGADVLLSVNITEGVTRCNLQVIRDGVIIKRQSFVEGQGSLVDQALLASIESAINTFLIEG
jgi:hypothetical protein